MAFSSRTLVRVTALALIAAPALGAGDLQREVVSGWTAYVDATERRIATELADGSSPSDRFLVQDFMPSASRLRRDVLAGTVVMDKMRPTGKGGDALEVPSALVHHWRGAVFIPGTTLDAVLTSLRAEVPKQEDVIRSAVLARGQDNMRVYLRLQRTKIVTAVYNSEHDVAFRRLGALRASSASRSTRIAEVEHPETAEERELLPGEDRGYLWRLNAYWRYQEVPGGVIAECESLSLSRSVPFVLRLVAGPIINGTGRESMERTLLSLRQHFSHGA
jgi:hypothetical protein